MQDHQTRIARNRPVGARHDQPHAGFLRQRIRIVEIRDPAEGKADNVQAAVAARR
ncbi:hypothetical protein [Paracoccus angustae]